MFFSQVSPPLPRCLSAFVYGSQLCIHFLPLGEEADERSDTTHNDYRHVLEPQLFDPESSTSWLLEGNGYEA